MHVVQHLCFFGTAALFWWGIVHGRQGRLGYGAAVVYLFVTAVHGGVLGALLTVSPRVWYAPYLAHHPAGLTPLEDQQLAGLLMWIPAGLAFAAGALFLFAAWLRQSDRRVAVSIRRAARCGPREFDDAHALLVRAFSLVLPGSEAAAANPSVLAAASVRRQAQRAWSRHRRCISCRRRLRGRVAHACRRLRQSSLQHARHHQDHERHEPARHHDVLDRHSAWP